MVSKKKNQYAECKQNPTYSYQKSICLIRNTFTGNNLHQKLLMNTLFYINTCLNSLHLSQRLRMLRVILDTWYCLCNITGMLDLGENWVRLAPKVINLSS